MNRHRKAALITLAFSFSAFVFGSTFTVQAAETTDSESRIVLAANQTEETTAKSTEALKDEYIIQNGGSRTLIGVRKSWETGQAGIYINNKEVIRFRSALGEASPYERAQLAASRLHGFLSNGGNPREIKPGLEDNLAVIRAGETVLVKVDAKTAAEAKQPDKVLALTWSNLLRQALGADGIVRNQVASRGMFGTTDRQEFTGNYRSTGVINTGLASWYGPGFHGRRSANGSRFNMYALTAAHRTLPFGTLVRVMNHRTGKSCIVKITDRGPFHSNRIIDLSKGAASAIGLLGSGISKVTLQVLKPQ